MSRQSIESRFWSKVEKTSDCWLWVGSKYLSGYGRFFIKTKGVRAHRFSWQLANGPIPEGLCVCHKCDNPPCVKPEHLFLATHSENMLDAGRKGRNGSQRYPERVPRGDKHGARLHPERVPRGENCGKSRLTEADVVRIRQLHSEGRSLRCLGREYGVHDTTIYFAVRGLTWRHVQEAKQ